MISHSINWKGSLSLALMVCLGGWSCGGIHSEPWLPSDASVAETSQSDRGSVVSEDVAPAPEDAAAEPKDAPAGPGDAGVGPEVASLAPDTLTADAAVVPEDAADAPTTVADAPADAAVAPADASVAVPDGAVADSAIDIGPNIKNETSADAPKEVADAPADAAVAPADASVAVPDGAVEDSAIGLGPDVRAAANDLAPAFLVSGYVAADFCVASGCRPALQMGFAVTSDDGQTSNTDATGRFQLLLRAGSHQLIVSRPWYLTRRIQVNVQGDLQISQPTAPLTMWAGDLNEDGLLNESDTDLMEGHYNTKAGDPDYSARADVNCDGAISMSDAMIVGSHFEASTGSYPPFTAP